MIRGESFTIAMVFNAEYDIETRIQDVTLSVGNITLCQLSDDTIIKSTANTLMCYISSQNTSYLQVGERAITMALTDSVNGVRKAIVAVVPVQNSGNIFENEVNNESANLVLSVTYDITNIVSDLIIADIYMGAGLPHGGVEGQHIRKVSATNYDVEWSNQLDDITTESFDPNVAGDPAAYVRKWDATEGTFVFGLPDGGIIQEGKELFDYYVNADTVPLLNGDIVSIVPIAGNRKAIARTDVTNQQSAHNVIGMVTVASIAVGAIGRVTKFGEVHDLLTSLYPDGTELFVSESNAGKWATVGATPPNYTVRIGTVIVSQNGNGIVELGIQCFPKLGDLSDVNGVSSSVNKPIVRKADGVIDAIDNLTLASFAKTGSSDAEVLLGGGGSKTLQSIYDTSAGVVAQYAGEAEQAAIDAEAAKLVAQNAQDAAEAAQLAAEQAEATALANNELLGGIAYNAAAPTPGKSGKYSFTTGGNCTWLTGGAATVAVGDEVVVVFTAPSTYTYTKVGRPDIEQTRSQSTSKVPSSKLLDDEISKVSAQISTANKTYCNLTRKGQVATAGYSFIQNIEMQAGKLDRIELYCMVAGSKRLFFCTKSGSNFIRYKTITKTLIKGYNVFDLSDIEIISGTYFGVLNLNAELDKADGQSGYGYYAVSGELTDASIPTLYSGQKLAYRLFMKNESLASVISNDFSNFKIKKEGLISYFDFSEKVISKYGDYEGVVTGDVQFKMPKLTACESDYSCFFNGGIVTITDYLPFSNTNTIPLSIEFLIKLKTISDCKIVSNIGTTGWEIGIKVVNQKNHLYVKVTDGTTIMYAQSKDSLSYNKVSHIFVSFAPKKFLDAGSLSVPSFFIEINGVEQVYSGTSSNLFSVLNDISIGATNLVFGDANFIGYIDEMAIWQGMPNKMDIDKRRSRALSDNYGLNGLQPICNNLILDIDLDGDSDDCGDVYVAKMLHNLGDVNLIGVVASTRSPYTAPAIKEILEYMSDTTTPVYAYQGSLGVNFPDATSVGKAIRDQFRPTDTRANYTSDVIGYRTMLASAEDNSVTIVTTGFLISVKALMDSPADGISGLTGLELIDKKVNRIMIVGNMFPTQYNGFHEYNSISDKASWKYVVENFTKEMIFAGGEIGMYIKSKPTVKTPDDYLTNPIRFGYKFHIGDAKNNTWGQLLLLMAAYGTSEYFSFSQKFTPTIDLATGDISIRYNEKGNATYLRLAESFQKRDKLQAIMDDLFILND